MDYVKKAKNGDRLIYCSVTQFANQEVFQQKVDELRNYLTEIKVNFKSTPVLSTKSDKYFVRILGLRDIKLWDIDGVIK